MQVIPLKMIPLRRILPQMILLQKIPLQVIPLKMIPLRRILLKMILSQKLPKLPCPAVCFLPPRRLSVRTAAYKPGSPPIYSLLSYFFLSDPVLLKILW